MTTLRRTLAVAGLLLAGCGRAAPVEQAVARSGVDPTVLEIRPVIGENEPPCNGNELPYVREGKLASCLSVGATVIDATTVKEPVRFDIGGEWGVEFVLTDEAADRFDQLAAEQLGERIAIISRGRLLSAPIVASPEYEGSVQVRVASREDAESLVRDLGGYVSPPVDEAHERELARDMQRARAVCAADEAELGGGLPHTGTSPWTAGAITRITRRELGRTVPPWDSLPENHFVAGCTYRGMPEGDDPAPVKHAFVDEEGRSSGDPLADACGPDSTCFYPTG